MVKVSIIMEDFYTYNRAYLIRFRKFDDSKTTYLNNYVLPNLAMRLDADIADYIAIEEDENGKDVLILFLEDTKTKEFINFCNEEDIIEYHEDITKKLLLRDNLDDVIQKMIWSEEFENKFIQFFKKNTTVDTVLQKILINGEDSLTDFEFQVLKDSVHENRVQNYKSKKQS